jgi:dTDP-4-dehydrorhamnose 3,5-epimerase
MIVTPLELEGLLLVELKVYRDERGFFVERFNRGTFLNRGLPAEFVQDNHSRSNPGVVRGLHFQERPGQGKLVGVLRGRVWDVAVDLRSDSATRGRWHAVELSDENGRLLWIPAGFAHGFCVLGTEPADVIYKVDHPYAPANEGGITWSDPDLAISWPVAQPILSPRDQALPSWKNYLQNHR